MLYKVVVKKGVFASQTWKSQTKGAADRIRREEEANGWRVIVTPQK